MSQQPDEDRQPVKFKGPGQWRSQADQVQPGLSRDQLAELDRDDDEPGQDEARTISSQMT